jgi:cytochrome c553
VISKLSRHLPITFLAWATALIAAPASAEDAKTGEQIYQESCVRCHGAHGEGVKEEYAKPLVGDRPLDDLTKVIVETMPEDEPEKCVGDDAAKVAAYIFDAFYSKAAQARNSRPRVELSRLTVRQFRESVADLIGGFHQAGGWDDQRGLKAEYFNAKHFHGDKRVLERRDGHVDFRFGEASPLADQIDAAEFCIRWEGAVLALETGEYVFNIKTENGARLWVNDLSGPLIDAWVRSGSDVDHRETIRLLGGRVYPLKLEFFKSKDDKTTKTASIVLMWRPPSRVEEVISERQLTPNRFPPTFVIETAFPPDDRSTGYERGSSVSKAWDQAVTYSAIEVADYVVGHLRELSGAADDAPDRTDRVRDFCRRFAERSFRRPLTAEQRAFFIDRHFDGGSQLDAAVKRVVLLILKSPRFLYRELGAGSDGPGVAARLSFALWDSLPDQPLNEAAARGELATREQVTAQAQRMAGDLRTKAKLREFFHQWLKVDQVEELRKDAALFPEFNDAVVSDLWTSLDLFLDEVVWSESSDFRQLFLADQLYLNGRLSALYGGGLPPDAPFQKVTLDANQRSGIVSHPFLLARFAYHATSSPIHRGVFVVRSLLGRQLRPPPEAVAPLSPELHPDMTTRERVTLQTSPATCATCHSMINPLGFPLEHYDALGRYRSEEKGRPIDDAGMYQTLAGQKVEVRGARELANFLANSEEAHAAFVEQLFHYLVKQAVRAFGTDRPEQLRRAFAESGFNIRRLLVEIAVVSALDAAPEVVAAN